MNNKQDKDRSGVEGGGTERAGEEPEAADHVFQHAATLLLQDQVSVMEFAKLAQLKQGMTREQIKEILVRWVEESGTGSADKT